MYINQILVIIYIFGLSDNHRDCRIKRDEIFLENTVRFVGIFYLHFMGIQVYGVGISSVIGVCYTVKNKILQPPPKIKKFLLHHQLPKVSKTSKILKILKSMVEYKRLPVVEFFFLFLVSVTLDPLKSTI